MRAVDGHDVRGSPMAQPCRDTQRLCTTTHRSLEQGAAGGWLGCRGQDVAGTVMEALRIFELAQLAAHVDQHVGVAADTIGAARRQER